MEKINPEEAKSLVDRLGPHLDSRCDFTYAPVFPKTRSDVCAVDRIVENGTSYGFSVIYLVWKSGGELKSEYLVDTKLTKDYLHIDDILEDGEDIVVKIRNGGAYSGEPSNEEYRRSKETLGLR